MRERIHLTQYSRYELGSACLSGESPRSSRPTRQGDPRIAMAVRRESSRAWNCDFPSEGKLAPGNDRCLSSRAGLRLAAAILGGSWTKRRPAKRRLPPQRLASRFEGGVLFHVKQSIAGPEDRVHFVSAARRCNEEGQVVVCLLGSIRKPACRRWPFAAALEVCYRVQSAPSRSHGGPLQLTLEPAVTLPHPS